jgi:uncharacterized membrane protein HdeD (DUF308 family)
MTQANATTCWQRFRAAIQSIPEKTQRRLQVCLTMGPVLVWIGWLAFIDPFNPCIGTRRQEICPLYTAMAEAANTSVENINAAIYVVFGIALICAAVADLILWWQGRRQK